MNKPFVVLADLDANYLVPLEDKLTEELYDQIELEIITEREYFEIFFSTPRKIDTLIVSDFLYSQNLQRHNITDIFVLSEEHGEKQTMGNVSHIFKYSSTKEIFNQVLHNNKEILNVQFSHKETEIIVVTSAIGGSGKTSISYALSQCIANNHKRVLYISTDAIQSFAFYLQNKGTLPNDIFGVFNNSKEKLYESVKPYLRHEGVVYLPPFGRSVSSIGLDYKIYNRFIEAAKSTKEYDYIVVDVNMKFDECEAELIKVANKVIVLVLQDSYSVLKTEFLVKNIDCRDSDKFIFICNKFRRDIDNLYVTSYIGQQFILTEYIDELPAYKCCKTDAFVDLEGVRKLAYLFS